jgi:5-methylcytosine-specific restriction endonuclease McrA
MKNERDRKNRQRKKGRSKFWDRYGGPMTCFHCGVAVSRGLNDGHPQKATIDHLTPLAHGGSHNRNNMVVSCYECNQLRGTNSFVLLPELRKLAKQ